MPGIPIDAGKINILHTPGLTEMCLRSSVEWFKYRLVPRGNRPCKFLVRLKGVEVENKKRRITPWP